MIKTLCWTIGLFIINDWYVLEEVYIKTVTKLLMVTIAGHRISCDFFPPTFLWDKR